MLKLTLASVQAQEDACVLPTFDSTVAWELGTTIRAHCQRTQTLPAVVYIAHANASQLLFCATTGPGTGQDDMVLVKRKEAVVLRWGVSSLRMRLEDQSSDWTPRTRLMSKLGADPSVHVCHGGGFPVRVKNVEGVVGVIVVSGLQSEEDDHGVIVEGIQQYLAARADSECSHPPALGPNANSA